MIALYLNVFRLLKAIRRSWSSQKFRAALVLAVLILLSGTLFFRSVEGWSWVDSLYFSVATISPASPGELAPTTVKSKLFTILYLFVGAGVFVALFTQFARALLQNYDEDDGDDAGRK